MRDRINQKTTFLACAIVAILALSCACCLITGISIWASVKEGSIRVSNGIGFFNLFVDIVVGVFTVWGLYWAASEFAESAVKPDVRLLPGKGTRPSVLLSEEGKPVPMKKRPFHIPGWCKQPLLGPVPSRDPQVLLGLFLENEKSRAGRHILLVIRIHAVPMPTHWEFIESGMISDRGKVDTNQSYVILSKPYTEDFVVYRSPRYAGELRMHWNADLPNSVLPEIMELDYDVYTLDGDSHGKETLFVKWGEDA